MVDKLFPWGDEAVPVTAIYVLIILSNVMVGVIVNLLDFDSSWSDEGFTRKEARGMFLVIFFFVTLNYVFMGTKMFTRDVTAPRMGRKFRPADPNYADELPGYIGSRTIGNFLEQQVVFLIPFWIFGSLINYRIAEVLGAIWVGVRYLYPLCWGYFGKFNITVEVVTQVNYAIIHYFCVEFLFQGFGYELTRENGKDWWFSLLLVGSFIFMFFGVFMTGIGSLNTKVIVSGYKRYKTRLSALEESIQTPTSNV